MLPQSIIRNQTTDDHWAIMVAKNYDILSEKNKNAAKYFSRTSVSKIKGFDNVFCIDGYSMECIIDITNDLIEQSAKQQIYLSDFNVNGSTIFCSFGEGWANFQLFETLHKLIDFLQLKGEIVYTSGAINLADCYDKFCKQYNKIPRITCKFNENPSLFSIDNQFYQLPNDKIEELPFDDKKLFCSFNWNAWSHRLALIALLNHYDLINDGYITVPTSTKFTYDTDKDFTLLQTGCLQYIDQLDDRQQILANLEKLKSIYPLKIDDRTNYTDTDQPLMNASLKVPMLTARINSIFEIIAETRWSEEHFTTEKFFNPVAIGKPFIILAKFGMLKSVRSLGFKTFNNYIDESYDNIENDAQRTLAIVKEVSRLKNMRQNNPKEFISLVENCKVIAQYNLEFFVNNAHYPDNLYFKTDTFRRFMNLC